MMTKDMMEHCAMVHKRWGDDSNLKEANEAMNLAREAIAEVEEA
jgi:hypothetical protein